MMEKSHDINMVEKGLDFILESLRNCEQYYIMPETHETPTAIFFIVVMSKIERPVFCAMERKAWERLKYEDLSLSMNQADLPIVTE